MRRLTALLLAVTAPLTSTAAALASDAVPTPAVAAPPLDAAHALLARVLARVVEADGVDYGALVADHADLDAYRAQLALDPVPTAGPARMAHLINAYNAFTLALVVQLLPADRARWRRWSIKDGGGLLASVWKRYTFALGGQRYSLDQIEHELLRPMGDPRVHFAINCASRSCPRLAATPYLAATLEADLQRATAAFVGDPSQLRVTDGAVVLNPILDWFAADFEARGGVAAFLAGQTRDAAVKAALAAGAKLRFFDYDWHLNLAGAR